MRENSRVVRADVRFCGTLESLCLNAWFLDNSELQRLIDALIELRGSVGDRADHVHLQHYDLGAGQGHGLGEVNFFRPGRGPSDLDNDLIDTAAAVLRPQIS
jgi:hypothetical protein